MTPRKKIEPDNGEHTRVFEYELENRFQPVEPDPVFVDRLRKRLLTTPEVSYESSGFPREQLIRVMTVVMLVALAISAIVALGRLLHKPAQSLVVPDF